ncbi:histidine phosphatase family protein [bacterium]|nr:histidine phosphatase family protein [bacterium]
MKKSKTKKIIFVRHAIAQDQALAKKQKISDEHRALTSAGHKEFKKHAKKNIKLFKKVDLFVTSPYIRAVQTLDIIFDVLNLSVGEATIFNKATPYDNPKLLLKWLNEQKESKIVVVTHEPFMSLFMKLAFGKSWKSEKISKGSLIEFKLNDKKLKYKIY